MQIKITALYFAYEIGKKKKTVNVEKFYGILFSGKRGIETIYI